MDFEKFVKSPYLKKFIFGALGLIILALVFMAGMFVGMEKARFSYNWRANYYRNFGAPPPPPLFSDRGYSNAHGSAGQVIGVDGNTLSVKSAEGNEKIVLITPQTSIKQGYAEITSGQIKVNDDIVFIGSPNNQGQIEAKFIRILNP